MALQIVKRGEEEEHAESEQPETQEQDQIEVEEIDATGETGREADSGSESAELGQETISVDLPRVRRGDLMDAFGDVLDPRFQSAAFWGGTGLVVGEFVAEGARVSLGQTGTIGTGVKVVSKGLTGAGLLWLGSIVGGESRDVLNAFNMAALGNWMGVVPNVINFGSGGSPTTDLGATSQFAASMGARVRAAQLSNQQTPARTRQVSPRSKRSTMANNPGTEGEVNPETQAVKEKSPSEKFRRLQ